MFTLVWSWRSFNLITKTFPTNPVCQEYRVASFTFLLNMLLNYLYYMRVIHKPKALSQTHTSFQQEHANPR